MKSRNISIITITLLFMSYFSMAQCDYKVKVSEKIVSGKGEIRTTLQNTSGYRCILYSYENGNKMKFTEITGNDSRITFSDLPLDRYFRVEFTFNKTDNPLCSKWVSELIQFNN
ncbi:MAG: hypothetical protein KDC58_13895 [Cyclobacteriaceae bacterium]|nr:hypothetical protein [Cyclobacteriaceae bacterium]